MIKKRSYLKFVSLICLVCIVACRVETPAGEGNVQIPNPAAVFCEEQGYAYEIRTEADGSQHGVCIFPDGSECDGWDYYNGKCGPDSPRQRVGGSINLVAVADLRQTTQIDVLRREDGNDRTPANFEELFAISDDATIYSLVDALDEDLELNLRADCPALYTLVFHLTDGRQHEFGYACEMVSPSFLRGGQAFWLGQDVMAPDAFNRLITVKMNEFGYLEIPF